MASLHSAGKPILPPSRGRGAIDTGSDIVAVSTPILQPLGVPVYRQASTRTVAGAVTVDLYKVSVGVTIFADLNAPELPEPNLIVMALPTALPKIEVLLGLDLLMSCKLILDGPGKLYALDF